MRDPKHQRRIERLTAYIHELKSRPCSDCGETFHHAAMDFDHCRGVKLHNIALLARRGVALSRLEAELDKCDLVCKNCHAIRTWKRESLSDPA